MFTGLVSAVGSVESVSRTGGGLRLKIRVSWSKLQNGESIAVDGACLTVRRKGRGWFEVQVVDTSLDRTRFGEYRAGDRVNLERALKLGDRLGGHLVQGHVDGIGRVRRVSSRKDARVIDLEVPLEVARVSVPLGSITVDGVSLTVVAKPARRRIRISLVPYTLQHTNLGRLGSGSLVHIEGDVIGKYLREVMESRVAGRGSRATRRKPVRRRPPPARDS
ncbi:MAG TPA: riboflavin synthase [Gemmatimonadales bacterium]|nr:riboflavin synthase [Gemmatimonadales bacterium]